MLNRLLFILALLTSLPALAQQAADTAPARPNILVILADDLGFSDLGCFGSEIQTPNLDALAADGLRFTQFYNTAKCETTRVSLLSGLYPNQADNASLSRAVTMADVMQDAGYFTAMVGKWHLDDQPTDHGFMRYFGHLSGATNYFTGDNTFRLNGERWNDFGDDFYITTANADYAIRFIDEAQQSEQPMFMYMAFNAPHYPLHALEEDYRQYENTYTVGWDAIRAARITKQEELGLFADQQGFTPAPRPDHVPAWDTLNAQQQDWERERMAAFGAVVHRLDLEIGRVIDHLQERGMLDNTLVLFMSDNGACPFDRTRGRGQQLRPWDPASYWCYDTGWAHVGNTPFRLYKQNQHEGGITSPTIVHWPAGLRTEPGSITNQPAHLIDVMATAIDLGGAAYPEVNLEGPVQPLQGLSLAPILRGQQREAHDALYFRYTDNRALRVGDMKLVSFRGSPWELYNLSTDRTELHDLAADRPQTVQEMSELWHRMAQDVDLLSPNQRQPVADTPQRPNF